ncbi:replication initiator [Streptosporangium sp. NPDC006013]|uniref:replication initiator n=1 Tax=Streptosporangium sp. NPDC006013 TaxID=3155596 RepID=UPI0033A13239
MAGYIAKYATKGAEASGTVDHRLSCPACGGRGRLSLPASCERYHGTGLKPGLHLDALPVREHARRMIRTCWKLGTCPEYKALRLRPWAHMLGFRGHGRHFRELVTHTSFRRSDTGRFGWVGTTGFEPVTSRL